MREELEKLNHQTLRFYAVVSHFDAADNRKFMCVKDVALANGLLVADHVWLTVIGDKATQWLKPKQHITFKATVNPYLKSEDKSRDNLSMDYGLHYPYKFAMLRRKKDGG